MKEIKLTKDNKIEVLQEAIACLNAGGVIIYPTETSYGLGCEYFNRKALKKIYDIKTRERKKPLPVIVPNIVTASTLVEFPEKGLRLAMQYWPGPLTLVLPYRYCNWGICYDDYLALRVSNHKFVQSLISNYGKVLVATSANLSGQPNCYSPREIYEQFIHAPMQPDLFINAGELPHRQPTTIIKCTHDNKLELLRQGGLKIKIK